ncbi:MULTISPECIES: hypothetical protein [unclassified Rickettsia]
MLWELLFSGFPLLARMTYCCFYRAMQQSLRGQGMTYEFHFLLSS